MGYFEFLHGSRIICLPLNISEKLHMPSKNQKRQRLIAFIFVNTIQYPRILKSNIYHSNKRQPSPFFHPDTNSVTGHVLIHSVEKTHILFVTIEFILLLFLHILCFNLVLTPRKSLRFTRFRITYVNRPAVVPTNLCQSYFAFLLEVRCFLQLSVSSDSGFAFLSTPVVM